MSIINQPEDATTPFGDAGEFANEYAAIRNRVAISDQSHYGKFRLSGSGALKLLNHTNLPDIARLAIGKAMTSLMLREGGSVLADVYIIRIGDAFVLLTEGATPNEVAAHLEAHKTPDVEIEDLTEQYSLIGLDGPYSWELLKKLFGVRVLGMRYLEFLENQELDGANVQVIRAGKTGEFGYLLIVESGHAKQCFDSLMASGAEFDCATVGSEALDICRMENRFLNLNREGLAATNPLELNCRVMVDHEKEEYLGRDAIEALCESGPAKRIVGIRIEAGENNVPAIGAEVQVEGKAIGTLVNSGYSPALESAIGLAHLDLDYAYAGMDYQVDGAPAKTVSAPFIFNNSLTIRPQEDSYHSTS